MSKMKMVKKDEDVVCPKCGGMVVCKGTVEVSLVPVYLDEDGLYQDWTSAGSGEFEVQEYTCESCGEELEPPEE